MHKSNNFTKNISIVYKFIAIDFIFIYKMKL